MRQIPPDFDGDVVQAIDDRLDAVVAQHRVALPWVIESGSRAWGFPSPDSDYDCRFVFVRSEDSYLRPWRERDVIETPLDAVLDVNGWDLVKAVKLLSKGNAVLLEWLGSPFVYRGDPEFRDELLELAGRVVDRAAVGRHHTHVGRNQWRRHSSGADLPLKRLFYVLRPALTVQWLVEHPDAAIPPMDLPTLMGQTVQTDEMRHAVDAMVARKSLTRELGSAPAPPVIMRRAGELLDLGDARFADASIPDAERREDAADWFRSAVRRWGPT